MAKGSSFYAKIKHQQLILKTRTPIEFQGDEDTTLKTERSKNSEDLVFEKPLSEFAEELFQKKGPKREKVLELILQKFTNSSEHDEFITKGISLTLLHGCHNCIKSDLNTGKCTKETYLASRIIGLLQLDVGIENDSLAHEIFEDSIEKLGNSISKFYQGLKPGFDSSTISSLMDSLAIITLVGGNGPEDTERSMQIIWRFLHEELVCKPDTQVMISSISAWSFLLASIGTRRISSKLWKGSLSYFSNLLEESDQSVLRIKAAEIIAHIVEIDAIEKFSVDAMDFNGKLLTCKENGGSMREEMRKNWMNKVKSVVVELSRSNASRKDLTKSHQSSSSDVIAFLKSGGCPKTTLLIGQDVLSISKWSQLIQVDFMKQFLGSSFIQHVKKNKLIQDFYDFAPRAEAPHQSELYASSSEEESAGIRYVFQPVLELKNPHYFRVCVSENSILNKEKTQKMRKKRFLSATKNAGYYSASFGDDEG
ncbi:hypothetical protein AQUCO_08400044v1 [Aquilegia coerulea]|uniref:Interferon-related developmental regulator N-terminal domain-containing protein n=1 Tax=Aquilegia coerulea TaxID=218851 RepID=A0A2G5C6V4_AQUCA|nr:hypothetical protein AQUCO_08400044v1 [Aquilegia coerulea]